MVELEGNTALDLDEFAEFLGTEGNTPIDEGNLGVIGQQTQSNPLGRIVEDDPELVLSLDEINKLPIPEPSSEGNVNNSADPKEGGDKGKDKATVNVPETIKMLATLGLVDTELDVVKTKLESGVDFTDDDITEAVQVSNEAKLAQVLDEVDTKSQGLVKYLADGGNLETWIDTYRNTRTLIEEHELTDLGKAEQLLKEVYKARGWDDAKIDKKLTTLRNYELTTDEANDEYASYKSAKEQAIPELNKRQEKAVEDEAAAIEAANQELERGIEQLDNYAGLAVTPKQKKELLELTRSNALVELFDFKKNPNANKVFIRLAMLHKLGMFDDQPKVLLVPNNTNNPPADKGAKSAPASKWRTTLRSK